MGQDHLADLPLVSVERTTTEKTDFEILINCFAMAKARMVELHVYMYRHDI